MRYLIVPIEAGAEKCEDCEHLSVLGNYCNLYEECFNSPELAEHQLRLPACLAAEKKLADLIEAGEDSIGALDMDGWPGIKAKVERARAAIKEG